MSKRSALRAYIEERLGVKITRGWHLDGAGPARFGWGAHYPSRIQFLGRTLEEAKTKIDEGS